MKDTDFKIDCKYEMGGQDYSKREFTVQYNETDLDFISRLLEEEGIFYWFDHSGDREVLMISNKKEAIQPVPNTPKLPLRPETGMFADAGEYVGAMQKTLRWVTGSRSTLKDYNYRTPETNVIGSFDLEGATGEYYHFGDHVKTTDEAKRLAQVRGEMFYCDREIYRGSGIARSMHCGHRFTLEHADSFDGDYLLTRVLHKGDLQREGDDGTVEPGKAVKPHYTNNFECIPASVQFRPRMVTPKPKAPGILTALVDGQKGSYAYLDDEGRYRMKLFFDRSEDGEGKASKAIRLAQPYAGPGYGMHFPLHTGTEIAVGFVDGDLDRPIGLGAIPNPGKGSPVKAGNKSQNMMKSHSGNSVILEDKEGKTGVHIASSGGHAIGLDDSASSKGISLGTSGKNTVVLDDTNKNIGMGTTAGHALILDDKGQQIGINSKGANSVVLDDKNTLIHVGTAGGHLIDLKDNGAEIAISSTGKIAITAVEQLTITVGEASLLMKKDGTIALGGKDITIAATASLTMGGKTVSIDGADKLGGTSKTELSLGVGPTKVELKPDGLTTGGPKISSSAMGVHEISGAVIKLN
jgi:type VI secretion system secreted protein VgrG